MYKELPFIAYGNVPNMSGKEPKSGEAGKKWAMAHKKPRTDADATEARGTKEQLFTPPAGIVNALITDFTLCRSGNSVSINDDVFDCISKLTDSGTGARAFAFKKADELRLVFPGRSNAASGTPKENAAVAAILSGSPSPQLHSIEKYMGKEVLPYLAKHPLTKVHVFGHSMGAGNALLAKHMLDKEGITVTATLFEPLAPTQTARAIIEDATKEKTPEEKAYAVWHLQRNITSIRSYPITGVARIPVGNSSTNNKAFGERAFFLSGSPDKKATSGFSRRAFLASPAKIITVPHEVISGGEKAANKAFDEAGHTLSSCLPILEKLGDQAIQGAALSEVSHVNEVLHPERYPHPRGAITYRSVTGGYFEGLASDPKGTGR
jgi:Lipase (class 3)